jgi:tetratricopeptide (TPR) repeat protein
MKYDSGNENEIQDKGRFEKEKMQYIEDAISYMEKCAAADNEDFQTKFPPPPAITLARYNGVCEGSHKLYSFGKYYFQKYLLLTSCDEWQRPEADLYRSNAEEFFIAALRFPAKPENARQSRAYIAEKLARVYISKGEYKKAIQTLSRYIKDRTDYYIRYTYATVCLLSGKYEEAGAQSVSAMKFEKSNLEMWLGYFLLYVKCLRENKTGEAEKNLKLAEEVCKRTGRKSTESLIIGQAYINYKRGDREAAVNCLREAEKINPNRKGIRQKIRNWEKNSMD